MPLPFAVEVLHARGPWVVAGGRDRSVVLGPTAAASCWLPHGADEAAAAETVVAVLDRSREALSLVVDGVATTYCLASVAPREVALSRSGDGCAVRGEVVMLERRASGAWQLAHDGRLDPALPGPSWAFSAWVAEHGAGGGDAPGDVAPGSGVLREPGGGRTLETMPDERLRRWVVMKEGDRELARVEASSAAWAAARGTACPVAGTPGGVVALASGCVLEPPAAQASPPAEVTVTLPCAPSASESADGPLLGYLRRYPDDPRAASLWGEVGRRLRHEGRLAEAVDALRRATRLAGGGPGRDRSLDFELVEVYRQRGEHELAVGELRLLVERLAETPDDATVFDARLLMAEILSQRLRRPAEAVPVYEDLVARYETFFPDDTSGFRRAKARLYLGLALEGLGRREDALRQYEAIPRESPTGAFVRYAGERAGKLR